MNTQGTCRRRTLATLMCCALLSARLPARANTYPARPIKLLVGASPGGPADFTARLFAESAAQALGQAMVVENKPGASGTIAARAVARAPADGYTLLVAGPASMIVAPELQPLLGYEPHSDFVPVAILAAGALVMVVNSSLPATTVKELIRLAHERPEPLTFGSGGNGSTSHLCAELFMSATGARMTHVPYKGDAQAVADLVAGQIDVGFIAPHMALQHAETGRMRAIAVTSRDRVAPLADTPTVAESGVPDFEYLGWIALYGPKAMPQDAVDKLTEAWRQALAQSAVRERLKELAMLAPQQICFGQGLSGFLEAEAVRIGRIVRALSIKPS